MDAAARFFGFQGFIISDVETRSRHLGGRVQPVKVVTLDSLRRFRECRFCGRRIRRGAFPESEPVFLRDCSLGDLPTFVEVYVWRVQCCGKVARERLPFEARGLNRPGFAGDFGTDKGHSHTDRRESGTDS